LIFVDTGAFFALCVTSDPNHSRAVAWMRSNAEQLLTTDYVVDETLTLLRARRHHPQALHFGVSILTGRIAEIEWVTPEQFHAAWGVFRTYQDKAWSFTDCVSRVVMQERGIGKAFSFDEHFQQFGTVVPVP
jgi:uncharacterized protein